MEFDYSIIIPAYNASNYLEECIISLYEQELKNFEVIVVNDGSTDDTLSICEQLASKYSQLNINLINQSNKGQISARFNGIRHAKGKYLIFLDADDKLRKDAIEIIDKARKKYKADIIIYNGVRFWGDNKVQFMPHYKDYDYYMVDEKFNMFRKLALTTKRFNNVWNKAYKRELISINTNIEELSYIRLEEDYLMQLPWYDKAQNAVYVPENIYEYRLNESSETFKKFDKNRFRYALSIFQKTEIYYKKWNIANRNQIRSRRFIGRTIAALKQIRFIDDTVSLDYKISLLKEVGNNELFRQELPKVNCKIQSKVGFIILWLIYFRLWRIALFFIEHAPNIHGEKTFICYK